MKDILVLGGGDESLYQPRERFFEVGSHPTSDFGSGQDWSKQNFWLQLIDVLSSTAHQFRVIIMDEGSSSWFELVDSEFFARTFIMICDNFLSKDGVVILEAYFLPQLGDNNFLSVLHYHLIQHLPRLGYFCSSGNTDVFFIYGKESLDKTVIHDIKGIEYEFFPFEKRNGHIYSTDEMQSLIRLAGLTPVEFGALALQATQFVFEKRGVGWHTGKCVIVKNLIEFITTRIFSSEKTGSKFGKKMSRKLKRQSKKK